MASENAEVVRDQYAATNERDFKRVMSHYAEDVVLAVHVPGIRSGTFTGREAAGRWFGDWFSTFDREAHFVIGELTEFDDGSILVVAQHHARGRASGVEVRGTFIWLYRLHDGKIVRVDGFPTRDEALAAVASREAGL